MTAKVTHPQEFFVVGGPVQPDRACYVSRSADEALLACIAEQRFASVLAPRAMGKSSLMARTLRRLRADGQLAAVVDFNQIAPRAEQIDSARWHYGIAYRICRELRLKTDLQDWWHDKNLLLSEQRLVEFFQEIVLANTETAVTIFFDEAERAAELPYVGDLFAALHSCYMRRVSEPDFARLNFVVLGAASRDQLCPDSNASPFVAGRSIRLEDFSLEECKRLAPGLAESEFPAETLLSRVHFWTHGQPYLTQKLARGVARRGGHPADVDGALHDLFLAPGVSREEPLLHHMREMLLRPSPRRRHAVALLERLARGQEVIHDPSSPAQRLLDLSGFVSSDDNGMLRFRNRIVEQVFGSEDTLEASPLRWRRPATIAAAAAAVVAVVALPYWYARVLPRPEIALLESGINYAEVEAAHGRLGRLPGFGGLADRLFAAAMARRSAAALTLEEATAADTALRLLPDTAAQADALMGAFWLRQAGAAAALADRDTALLASLAAARHGSADAGRMAAELIDGDYRQLVQSVYLDAPVLAAAVDWERDQAVIVDANRRVHLWPLEQAEQPSAGGAQPTEAARTLPSRMTALEHVGMTRGFFVDETGRAGSFELRITLEHPRTSDVLVRLTAPSGAATEVELPARSGGVERFVLAASADNGLAALADESITGHWEITLFDRLAGETGTLVSWGLRFPGVPQNWDDAPAQGLPLPDPVRTEQVSVSLTADGRLGVTLPARPDARGAATVWDLSSAAAVADLPLAERASGVAMLGSDRLLIYGMRQATLWELNGFKVVGTYQTPAAFIGRPAISPDGDTFALAESADGAARVSVLRADDGSTVGRFATDVWRDWVLAPQARYLAGIDGSRRGRILDPASGDLMAEFFHERELSRLVQHTAVDRIIAVDTAGDIFAWVPDPDRSTLSPRDSTFLGSTTAPGSLDLAGSGQGLAFADAAGMVTVVSPADGRRQASFEHGESRNLVTRLDAAAKRLVTLSDNRLRYWRLRDGTVAGAAYGAVSAVALDDTGELGVLGFRGGEVAFMPGVAGSAAAGKTGAAINGHRGIVTSLAINASGNLAASGGSEGVVRVWNAQTGMREPNLLRHPAGPIRQLEFSADDQWLFSAGPNSVRVFELATGATRNEIHTDGIPLAIAVDSTSRILAVGDDAGNIVLAAPDGSTGEIVLRANAPITALAFAPDSALLASGSAAGDLGLWDTLALGEVAKTRSLNQPVTWLQFLPEDSALLVRSGSWLHRANFRDSEIRIVASRLLPDQVRTQPALAIIRDGAAVRALATGGGGYLAYTDIAMDSAAADGVAERPVLTAAEWQDRDWRRVLGLELDPVRGLIRRVGL